MIGFIRGRVGGVFAAGKTTAQVVLMPFNESEFGVGYTILLPIESAVSISVNDVLSMWTYAVHTENDSYLIGLTSKDAVELFLHLISVSGVGPRSAMMVLSKLSVDEVKAALRDQDVVAFSKVPGIGKKTAAKIVLDLSGREFDVTGVVDKKDESIEEFPDILATLVKLGYTQNNAKEAIKRVSSVLRENKNKTTAEKVKLVLSHS